MMDADSEYPEGAGDNEDFLVPLDSVLNDPSDESVSAGVEFNLPGPDVQVRLEVTYSPQPETDVPAGGEDDLLNGPVYSGSDPASLPVEQPYPESELPPEPEASLIPAPPPENVKLNQPASPESLPAQQPPQRRRAKPVLPPKARNEQLAEETNPSQETKRRFSETAKGNTGKLSFEQFLQFAETMSGIFRDVRTGETFITNIGEAGKIFMAPKKFGDKSVPVPPNSPDPDNNPPTPEIVRPEQQTEHPKRDKWESVDTAYTWFYSDLYEEEQTFAMTLAFFSGASQSDVLQAHKYVKQILEVRDTNYGAGFDGQRSTLATPLPSLMKATHAEFMDAYVFNNAGQVEVRGISYNDTRAVSVILEMLAKYNNDAFVKILNLLIAVAWDKDSSWGVYARKRASTTLGLIARTEFNIVKSMVLDKWVRTGLREPRLRYATATLVSTIYIPNGKYNSNIYVLVSQWAGTRNNPSFVKTAIVVASQLVSHNFKDYFDILKMIIMYDQTIYLGDLGAAFISIYQDLRESIDNCHYAVHYVQKLAEWACSPHESLHIGTLFLALQLMAFTLDRDARMLSGEWEFWNLPVRYKGANQAETDTVRYQYRSAIHQIFACAFSSPPLIVRLAGKVLEALIAATTSHPDYRIFVRYIFADLCCSPTELKASRLVWDWLNVWSKAPRLAQHHQNILEVVEYIRPRLPQRES